MLCLLIKKPNKRIPFNKILADRTYKDKKDTIKNYKKSIEKILGLKTSSDIRIKNFFKICYIRIALLSKIS
jgi:hypothetical protein